MQGEIYKTLGQYDKALEAMDIALTSSQDHPLYICNKALVLMF